MPPTLPKPRSMNTSLVIPNRTGPNRTEPDPAISASIPTPYSSVAMSLLVYDPTIEDSYRKQILVDGKPCQLEILDTAGQEEYISLRDQWIRDGDGYAIVYSINDRNTFERIEKFALQIARVKESEYSSLLLIGNKIDLDSERQVSKEEGAAKARQLGAEFIETSAKTSINVEKAFHQIIRSFRRYATGGATSGASSKKSQGCHCIIV
ncbi:ras-related protein R-Ras2-like protein [Polychytrium aggregatum]|uniref:ras-related protein R-Ras2-like protein n=1 Tax=Polychytrium aggregatum TaxID=110093 RepID=UPI0022FE1B72|nr:ras-related protein R-Ras2-like protein [Polychytrium aggregatum]KAI9207501.1 ras-related protein R-Ras2-like protein [Polychytrium aggregatum]